MKEEIKRDSIYFEKNIFVWDMGETKRRGRSSEVNNNPRIVIILERTSIQKKAKLTIFISCHLRSGASMGIASILPRRKSEP